MAQKKRETLLQSQRRKLAEQRAAKAVADAAQRPTDTDENRNRIRKVVNNVIGVRDPDIVMDQLLQVLEKSEAPIPGKLYVYKYVAITPGIRYDQNPLVAVTNVFDWGFKGINFHWGQSRSYTFQEVASQLYQVTNEELQDLSTIPFAKFRINN